MTEISPTGMKRLHLALWSAALLAAIVAGLALWMAPRVPAASAPAFQGEADIYSALDRAMGKSFTART